MKCLVCENNRFLNSIYGGYEYNSVRYTLKRCKRCGFIFIDPIPDEKVLKGFYEDNDYFLKYYCGDTVTLELEREFSILSRIKPEGRLLDVGCANGSFLKIAKEKKYDVYGIEPNMMMVEFVRKRYNIDITNGKLKKGLYKEKYFDIIRFSDVLEHLNDPAGALKIADLYLKDDGLILINQPLTYNRCFFNFILAIKMLLRKTKFSNNPPYHIWEFGPRTLEKFLNENGFKNILFKKIYESTPNSDYLNFFTMAVKKISFFISNAWIFKFLQLGNRMLILATKD